MAGSYFPLGLLAKDKAKLQFTASRSKGALVASGTGDEVPTSLDISTTASIGARGLLQTTGIQANAVVYVPLGITARLPVDEQANAVVYVPLGIVARKMLGGPTGSIGQVVFTAIISSSPQRADVPIDTRAVLNIEGTVEEPPIDTTVKGPVVAATTSAGTLASDFENGDTIDGVTLSTGDRILIKNQVDASENGIYVVNASGAPTRAEDADQDAEVFQGVTVQVAPGGTTNGDTSWYITSADPIEVDVDDINWSQSVDPVPPVNNTGWIFRNSESYTGPSLTNGRPDSDWQPSSTTTGIWGRPRILINGRDRTYYRGGTAQITNMSITEPFGDAVAQIRLPKVTPFDSLDSILPKWAEVEIQVVRGNGTRKTLWMGSIASWESDQEGTTIQCVGAFYEADRFLRKPVFYNAIASLENHIVTTINYFVTYYDLNLGIMTSPSTGISLRARGGYEKVATGYIADLIAKAQTNDGGLTQYTIECENRQPRIVEKDRTTTNWTVQTGGRGIQHSISADHVEGKANQFYAEGVGEDNCHWRNSRYLYDYSQAFIWPLVATVQTESIGVNADPNNYHKVLSFYSEPSYDPSIPRFELYKNFGNGADKAIATDVGIRILGEFFEDGWIGSITLNSDPIEGSRFEIRAGENIVMRDFHGENVKFHIVEANHDFQSLTTTLMVDTMARDRMDVVAIHQRNSEALEDPRSKLNLGRRSRHTEDRIAVWDCESGFGIVPEQNLMGGYYSMWGLPAGEVGQVVRSKFWRTPYFGSPTTAPIEFEVMIFDREINLWDIVALGVPSYDDAFWSQENMEYLYNLGMLIGWQHGGYWPGDSDDGLTGILQDDASWYFEAINPPFLWIVGATQITAPFGGRLYPAGEYEIA